MQRWCQVRELGGLPAASYEMRFTLSAGYSDVEIRVPVVFSETKTEPVRREPRSSRQNRRGVSGTAAASPHCPAGGMERMERSAPTEGTLPFQTRHYLLPWPVPLPAAA